MDARRSVRATMIRRMLACCLTVTTLFSPGLLRAQRNEAGGWASLQLSKALQHNWTLGVRGEIRGREEMHSLDLAFLRAMAGYRITPWMGAELAVDRMWRSTSAQNRMLLSLTGTWGRRSLALSVRQRYIYAHNGETHSYAHLMRTMVSLSCHMGDSRWTPYISVEGYYWDRWQMTHTFIGSRLRLDSHNSLDLFYVCNIKATPAVLIHSIGAGYACRL